MRWVDESIDAKIQGVTPTDVVRTNSLPVRLNGLDESNFSFAKKIERAQFLLCFFCIK